MNDPLREEMLAIGRAAKAAARALALAPAPWRDHALAQLSEALRTRTDGVLAANARDMADARAAGLSGAMLDRLRLDASRVAAMADGVDAVRAQPDPVGQIEAEWTRPNGLRIQRVRVPLGVVGVIFESRPNVTIDAAAIAIKAGSAVILRGGSESLASSRALGALIADALHAAHLPAAAVQVVPTADRRAVGVMLEGLGGALDLLIPRGGKSLVARVEAEARVPVLGHLEGRCTTYVHAAADLAKARSIVMNAKLRRTGVCGATETLLVDKSAAATHLGPILSDLIGAGCEVRGDEAVQAADTRVKAATPADYETEFLDAILAARVVDGVGEAIAHIAAHGSAHTDAIVTEDAQAAERFLREVDSAIVLQNASTQFADGGEFGFGAEIGIATGKLHARGPVGPTQLTTYKYVVRGTGQTRP